MTDDLVAFLKACVDEDQRVALAAAEVDPGPWELSAWEETGTGHVLNGRKGTYQERELWDNEGASALSMRLATAAHIARHDPARVLAEVAAKRRIIDQCEERLSNGPVAGWETDRGYEAGLIEAATSTLRLLASVYAGRPGWRSEWAPDEEASRD